MSLLFVAFAVAVVLGAALLWSSGFLTGRGTAPLPPPPPPPPVDTAAEEARAEVERQRLELERLGEEGRTLREELDGARAEVAEMELKVRRADGASDNLRERLERSDQELGRLRAEMAALRKLRTATAAEGTSAGEEDSVLAKLDMERVAHAKTQEEVEKLRAEVARLQASAAPAPHLPRPPGAGPGLPRDKDPMHSTQSIATRGAPVSRLEHDQLRTEMARVLREKDKLLEELEALRKPSSTPR